MRVRMVESVSGSFDGKDYPRVGEVVDLDKSHAAELCASGHAVPVAGSDEERAVAPKPETRRRKS